MKWLLITANQGLITEIQSEIIMVKHMPLLLLRRLLAQLHFLKLKGVFLTENQGLITGKQRQRIVGTTHLKLISVLILLSAWSLVWVRFLRQQYREMRVSLLRR
jgi:hypothetical protein